MNLFVYGTLLVPRIWEAVTGTDQFVGTSGFIEGYEIYRVQGGDFPGIVPSSNHESRVPGKIFHDLSEAAIKRLDAYEDPFYERREVTVHLSDGTTAGAHSYVVPESFAPKILSRERWTLEWFEGHALETYWSRLFES